MYLELYGATESVTGSLHRLHVGGRDILLDCGLFQGHRAEANRLNRELPEWTYDAECLVLSHAHLDHSGNIPTLVKNGFQGNIFCTPPTRDLCSVMLRDAAMIQEQDARYLNKHRDRNSKEPPVEPLYSVADAQLAVAQMISLPLRRSMLIAPGVRLTFHDAGHVLGSALVQLDLEERGKRVRLLFTGDLGREELPLLQSPEIVADVDFLMIESTYGDRLHPELEKLDEDLADIVKTTIARGGRVYIPTFALERAQEVLFSFERLHERGHLDRVPIHIDSPLAIAITEIYKLHPESLSSEVQQRILDRNDPFSPPGLTYVSDVASSKRLQAEHDPCVIIAGAGMCEGGRIVHHLAGALRNHKNSVVMVGFMAQHTLGRRLVEGRRRVRVLGMEREVNASVHALNGLSAHADQEDLVRFTQAVAREGNVRRTVLVHGEQPAKEALRDKLKERYTGEVIIGKKGQRIEL